MRVHAVINRRAGAALGLDTIKLGHNVEAHFRRAGHEVQVDLVNPDAIEGKLTEAVQSSPDILLAGGGDGTVRSAASKIVGTRIALAILPLGTINRLARDLNIPVDPDYALQTLPGGVFRQIDAAEVNGKIFLCNSLLGLPPEISEERQHLRGQPFATRVNGYFKLLRTILASRKRIELFIDDQRSKRRVRLLSLAVSNNLYRQEPTLVFGRQTLDGGVLGLYIAKPRSGLGLIWVLARAALGLWKGDARLDSLSAKTVTIASGRKSIRLSNDGEVETLAMPLRYRIHPKALTVFAPQVVSS